MAYGACDLDDRLPVTVWQLNRAAPLHLSWLRADSANPKMSAIVIAHTNFSFMAPPTKTKRFRYKDECRASKVTKSRPRDVATSRISLATAANLY